MADIVKTMDYKGSWVDRFRYRIPEVNHLFGVITHAKDNGGAMSVINKNGVDVYKASRFQVLDGNAYLQDLENDLKINLVRVYSESEKVK